MGVQYSCKNLKRREAVRAQSGLNGIDYLEVLDHDAPKDGGPRQQTLLVWCLQPAPALTVDNRLCSRLFQIETTFWWCEQSEPAISHLTRFASVRLQRI